MDYASVESLCDPHRCQAHPLHRKRRVLLSHFFFSYYKVDTKNPTRIRKVEDSIHFQPTFSACFSASRDQGAVPNRVSPIFDADRVEDSEIPTPVIRPSPPSKKRTRARVSPGTRLRARRIPAQSMRVAMIAASKGFSKKSKAGRSCLRGL